MTPALAILCYHRLVEDSEIESAWPYLERGTAVRMDNFRAQLRDIADLAEIISEPHALDVLAGRRHLARPAVWLTFDDGYRDVLRAVGHASCGTAFVTTSVAERPLPADAWFSVLRAATRMSGTVDLGLGPFEYCLCHREGRVRLVNGPERRAFLHAAADEQAKALRTLAEQVGGSVVDPVRYLSQGDMLALLAAGWSIGSHGVTHTPFEALDPEGVVREARQSLARFATLPSRVRSIALPDGSRPRQSVDLHACGYECILGLGRALAARGAPVQPRLVVADDPRWVELVLKPMLETGVG